MKTSAAVQKLEKAYFDMLENVHYSKISVSDIISKAGVSRTTFYRHYVDIFDMHKKVAENFGNAIIEECFIAITGSQDENDYFDAVFKIFNSQEKYIVLISGENGSRYFFEALYRKVTQNFLPLKMILSEEQAFRLKFMTIAMIGIYVKDIIEHREHNLEYIKICKRLINFDELSGGYNG